MKKFLLVLSFIVFIITIGYNLNIKKQNNLYPPTEITKGHNEEKASFKRKQWLKEIHKVAPGTDWKKIEKKQWNNHVFKRNLIKKNARKAQNWIEQGSVNVSGRTHHAILSGDGNNIFIGTNGGGVWRGKFDPNEMVPEDMEWTPLGDNCMGGAMQIAILHQETDVIVKSWDNTIHYSKDLGNTWHSSKFNELPEFRRVYRFLTIKGDSKNLFGIFTAWDKVEGTWIYKKFLVKSIDNGESFKVLRDLGENGGDIWTSRIENGPLYLFTDKSMYVSNDLGENFDLVGSFTDSEETDVILTGSEAGAPTFYVARKQDDTWNLYKSEDGGVSWTFKNTITENYFGMNSFFRSLTASILNPELLAYGGVETYRSENGGDTFTRINTWQSYYNDNANKLHADVPGIDVIPLPGGGERWYISTDGGTYVSEDGCQTVHSITLSGLRNSQYYSTLTDKFDENKIHAGAQDQGYQYSTGTVNGLAQFEQGFSGDYGQLTSSDGTLSTVYSVYPGFIAIVKDSTPDVSIYAKINFPSDIEHAQWLPMVVADPDNEDIVYFCGSKIVKYKRQNALSTYWARTNLPFDFSDSVNGDGSDYVSCLGISPANHDYWYAGTANGKFYYSYDRGQTWTEGSTIEPRPHYLYSLAVLCDENDPDIVTIAGSGYSNAAVWRSVDGGQTFTELGSNQPQCIFLDLAHSPENNGDIYAATTTGPYRYLKSTDSWVSILEGNAPLTEYWSVETLSETVRFGSFGRGIWDYTPTEVQQYTKQYVIPHIDWSSQWESRLIVDNLNNSTETFRVVQYKSNEIVKDDYISINSNESKSIDLMEGSCGLVYSNSNVIFREAFVHNTENGIAEFTLNKMPTDNDKTIHFLMPSYLSNDLTWMGVALFNPNETSTDVTLKAYNSSGVEKGSVSFTINKMERSVGLIETYFPELTLNDVARIKVTSTQPVTGINISGNNNEQLLFTKAVNEIDLDNTLNIAHIANEWQDWTNRLIFDNLSETESGSLTVTLYKDGGTVIDQFTVNVNANSSTVVNLNDKSDLAPTCGTISVDTGTVAVRQSYQQISQKGTAEFVLNSNQNSNLNFVFPSYSADILDWFGIGIFNPTENNLEITLTGYSNSESVGSTTITVNSKERKAFLLSDYFENSQIDRVTASTTDTITGLNISGSGHKRLLFTQAVN